MTGSAAVQQVYGETRESVGLLPMNDLDMESGYVLYSTQIMFDSDEPVLELENVRDYAAVYLDGVLQGSVTDSNKELALTAEPGVHRLDLYVENIGRITYGPEILDNFKGLFGGITLDGTEIGDWIITPLEVRECDVAALAFADATDAATPCFYRGYFELAEPQDTYLDVSGWGMGEVWMNGVYTGSFWEEEKQQSIMLPAEDMVQGRNEIIVFELKNNGRTAMKLSDEPVFK